MTKLNLPAALFAILALTACATPAPKPTAYLASDIAVVDQTDLDRYWKPVQSSISFPVSAVRVAQTRCGYVVTRFIIDSNGDVYNAEILESEPAGVFDQSALTALSHWEYEAAETNPDRTPVRVDQKTEFKTKRCTSQ